ncbi:ATP/GTP-binding protein [Streptomyces sp. A7024]|uniref:ATP/GTP-binding protein n=1 Tax=Streptomyces coryli TaxID=1128680 RepID=A0A6G4TW21_9ACTN|nr:ATP/GTP-binding protein [Streptomyces coryli]NGN63201.1 ATP/GTP-binding protein [Streptomyces coryli]
MLTRTTSTLAAIVTAVVLILAGSAHAQDDPSIAPPSGQCENKDDVCWNVTDPGKDGGKKPAGQKGSTGGGKKQKCVVGDKPVPCYSKDFGYYSHGCYLKKADPQPPASDPAWDGHKPGDGYVVEETCFGAGGQTQTLGWMAEAPGPGAAVDPAVLAQEALGKMTLKPADIHVAPKPGNKGVVGLPVWVWTTKSETTWGPNTASASAGGVTVTVTAKVKNIRWSMGDGSSVTCSTPGKAYKAAYGKRVPDEARGECGTDGYTQPSSTKDGGKYTITATSTWAVEWTGGGQSGELTETRQAQAQVTIAEMQVLN